MPVAKLDAAKRGPKPCPFCGIVSGDQKSFLVFDDALSCRVSGLPAAASRPCAPGPLRTAMTLADTPDDVMAALGVRLKRLSNGIMKAMDAGRISAPNNVVSQSVPHVHFHIVPRRKGDGLFSAGMIWKRVAYRSDEERESIAARIRAAIAEGAAMSSRGCGAAGRARPAGYRRRPSCPRVVRAAAGRYRPRSGCASRPRWRGARPPAQSGNRTLPKICGRRHGPIAPKGRPFRSY